MSRRYQTRLAAKFLSEHDAAISHRTLQNYRTKGADDPVEKGPRWFRDPQDGCCWYFEEDLLAWVRQRKERLIDRGSGVRPQHLDTPSVAAARRARRQ